MANVNLYTKFDYTDADGNLYSDGSTTTAKTISITNGEIFDRTYKIATGTGAAVGATGGPTEILSNDLITSFDFLYIESDLAAEIQLICTEGGTLSGGNIENGWVVKLNAGVPFVLHNDDSRNMGNMDAGFSEGNYQAEIDDWAADWVAGNIDSIRYYQATGSDAKVRVVAIG